MKDVILYPDPILREKHKGLPKAEQIPDLIKEMEQVLIANNALGLAAPQVGLPYRMFIAIMDGSIFEFVNPTLTYISDRYSEEEEACLSLPGIKGLVKRPRVVNIKAKDRWGTELNTAVKGIYARIVQHEMDHLNGTLFIDRMKLADREAILPQLRELESAGWGDK